MGENDEPRIARLKGMVPPALKMPGTDPTLFSNGHAIKPSPVSVKPKASKPRASPVKKTTRMQTSAFRGVSCCGKDRKWQVRIRDGTRVHYLGRYPTEIDAAFMYDVASREYKGESAPTNFVPMAKEMCEEIKASFMRIGGIDPQYYKYLSRGVLGRQGKKKIPKPTGIPVEVPQASPCSPMTFLRPFNAFKQALNVREAAGETLPRNKKKPINSPQKQAQIQAKIQNEMRKRLEKEQAEALARAESRGLGVGVPQLLPKVNSAPPPQACGGSAAQLLGVCRGREYPH